MVTITKQKTIVIKESYIKNKFKLLKNVEGYFSVALVDKHNVEFKWSYNNDSVTEIIRITMSKKEIAELLCIDTRKYDIVDVHRHGEVAHVLETTVKVNKETALFGLVNWNSKLESTDFCRSFGVDIVETLKNKQLK